MNQVGHNLRNSGALDHVKNGGFIGKYFSSHSEKKAAVAGNITIAVSRKMCSDCIPFFQKIAENTGLPFLVRDPEKVRRFLPSGEILEKVVK